MSKANQPKQPEQGQKAEQPKPKYGAGHAAAMFRLGISEIRNAVDPTSNGQGVSDSEMGLYGTATQGEVAGAKKDDLNAFSDLEQEGPGEPSMGEDDINAILGDDIAPPSQDAPKEPGIQESTIEDILGTNAVEPPAQDNSMDHDL